MFTAVGWIWVQEADYLDEFGDPASAPRPPVIEAVRDAVTLIGVEGNAVFRMVNAEHRVLIDTHNNHRNYRRLSETPLVLHHLPWPLELFEAVAAAAPGSFGVLHTWDDEVPDPAERHRFMRWTMVHGQITREEETAFAPVVLRWYDGRDPRSDADG